MCVFLGQIYTAKLEARGKHSLLNSWIELTCSLLSFYALQLRTYRYDYYSCCYAYPKPVHAKPKEEGDY